MTVNAAEIPIPRWPVPRFHPPWKWGDIPCFPPFTLADGSGPAVQQTRLRLCWDDEALHVCFECEDRDVWGTYRQRDDPLYEEEVVEVFLAPGEADPVEYFELEVSPLGTLFDARIHNPTSRRADMTADRAWYCPGLRWAAGAGMEYQGWWAELAIPWRSLVPSLEPPRLWRANFYRIERPRDCEPEFSGWSPTLVQPADFHRPARFGVLELAGSSTR